MSARVTLTGTVYRNGGGSIHNAELRALDVFRYERDELGNDDVVAVASFDRLRDVKAADTIWVCAEAYQYSGELTTFTADDTEVLLVDGDRGYLVREAELDYVTG